MVTGINSENRDHRLEVGELVVGGKELTAGMLDKLSEGSKEAKAAKLDDIELSGTYKNDHGDIEAQLKAIVSVLRDNGMVK